MSNIQKRVAEYLRHHQIDGEGILLACSGGIDSMALLDMLLDLGYKPAVAHCNFQLRGADADADEEFVKDFCREKGLRFFSKKFDTAEYANSHGISIQMAARDLRYTYFGELLTSHSMQFICTAHHADDSLETILLNLGRGTGFTGLGGIRPRNANLLRPMHQCTKKEIQQYAREKSLRWREDASNQKVDYQRNYLRHQVVPLLRKAFPSFEQSFGKSLNYLHEDRQLFENLLKKELDRLIIQTRDTEKLSIAELTESESAKALLRHWLLPKGPFDITAIYNSLAGESGAIFEAGDFRLLRDREFLLLKKVNTNEPAEFLISENDEAISAPFPMKIEKIDARNFTLDPSPERVALDFDKLKFPLKLRRWKKGDSFFPLGMKGAKKLSDYFVDRKYSRFDKENTWLLSSGEDIVWIVNDRPDDRFKLSDTTKTVYFARLLKNSDE